MNMNEGKDLVVNKYNKDYPDITKTTYTYLLQFHKYTARVADIWQLLKESYDIKEFDALDYEQIQNGTLVSWLIDRQIDWQDGKDINFTEVYQALLTAGDFTSSEKKMFESSGIEERLWAIFLLITNPELTL